MEKLINAELKLSKSVNKGDTESLLSLFSVSERFKRMDVLTDADEGAEIKVVLEGLGEVNLKLGADIEKGQQKTIMTLFWYEERVKPIEINKKAEAEERITLNIWKMYICRVLISLFIIRI